MTTVQVDPESPERPKLAGSWKSAEEEEEEGLSLRREDVSENENPATNLPVIPRSFASNTGEAPKLTFQDHYSLGLTPSSTVTFRGRRIQVYESHDEQFLLEEIDSSTLKLRRVSTGSMGQTILRVIYTVIAIFMAGFLFVFCFQIALFILMNLPVESGASEVSDLDGPVLAAIFCAIPVLLYGMASAMTLATAFVMDTWRGGQLVRSLTGWPLYVREWVAFTVFLGVPALVMVAELFANRSNWWEISSRIWVACVFLAFSVFCIGVILREVFVCWLVVAGNDEYLSANIEVQPAGKGGEGEVLASERASQPSRHRKWLAVLHQSFLISQAHRYSGVVENRYTVSGRKIAADLGASNGQYSVSEDSTPDMTKKSLYSRFVSTPLSKCLFEKLDPPERLFTVDEIRDVQPVLTRQNWSLEKMCCRDSRRSTIMAARGPASLHYRQALSSFACSIVGSLLILLLLAAFLVWAALDVILVVLLTLLVFLCCLGPMVKDSLSLYRSYKGIYEGIYDEDASDVDANIFQVWETKCVVRPRPRLCYAIFVIEFSLFFLWPLGSLYKNNSVSIATCFLVVAFLSFFRIYFNVGSVLARTGMVSFRRRPGDSRDLKPEETFLAQARTSEIVGNITENRSVVRWMYVFGTLSFFLYIAYVASVGETSDVSPSNRPEIQFSPEFYYSKPTDESLAYPNCKLTNVLPEDDELGTAIVQLVDFAFLSALAYEELENSQDLLDSWFGKGYLIDESEFVSDYRMQTGSNVIPVWYKLFRLNTTRTDGLTTGIVSVRGTESDFDWLVNMQLWLSSAMAEIVKNIVPFGFVFEPIIDDMVTVVNVIQSESLREISYYREVARFCRFMLDQGMYDQLRLTGASLGGGTAMISGAQERVPTVAISGPNAVLARRTFDPPVSLNDLDTYVFNVIPDRDPIAAIGGRARLFQEIACTAQYNDFFGCHSMWRTVCEAAFTCGAENRPALCMCVERFGYPVPQSRGTLNETFEELCGI